MESSSNLRVEALIQLMQTVDAFFPVGAFTLSNGIETYVLEGKIKTAEDLKEYLLGFLNIFPYQDLGLAHLAFSHGMEMNYLCKLDQMAAAMKVPSEIRNGSSKMGLRFLKARTAMGDCEGNLQWYMKLVKGKTLDGFHPIAVGIYGASVFEEQNEEQFLSMYGYSVLSAIVNNTVKLVPLSQMEGQRVLFEIVPVLAEAVKRTLNITADELGLCGTAMEISCMRHERLYSRQFMS